MDGCREDVMGNDSIKVPSLREDQVPAVERDLRSITKAE